LSLELLVDDLKPEMVALDSDSSLFEAVHQLHKNSVHRALVSDEVTNEALYILTNRRIVHFVWYFVSVTYESISFWQIPFTRIWEEEDEDVDNMRRGLKLMMAKATVVVVMTGGGGGCGGWRCYRYYHYYYFYYYYMGIVDV